MFRFRTNSAFATQLGDFGIKNYLLASISFVVCMFFAQCTTAQPVGLAMQELRAASAAERIRLVHNFQLERLDSAAFVAVYPPIMAIAETQRDWLMQWVLQFNFFLQRGEMKTSARENIQLLTELEEAAAEHNFEVGQIIARHYLQFEKYYADQLPLEAIYTHILSEMEQLQELGFEKFDDFGIDRLLYHNAKFMYELEDFDKALQIFQQTERYIRPTGRNAKSYILVLNHLQSIFQKKNDLTTAVGFAKKILRWVENPQTDDPDLLLFYRQWQGLTSLDMAAMLVKQGKLAESVNFAQKGYELAKAHDSANRYALRLEYDALQVLVSTKLELKALDEAGPLLVRLDELYHAIGSDYENYFNNIEYFECRARFHEMNGEFAEAIRYTKLAKPLQDSLARRNDARRLEQLTQRIEAEKYTEKIRRIEQEKELQKWLRNAALVILALVLMLAIGWIHRLRYLRRQKAAELTAVKKEFADLIQNFRAKSALAEKLRLELEQRGEPSDERGKFLEQLINGTILTDEDWLRFRLLFEKVYPGFLEKQTTLFPELTPAELRYLALEKLSLSTREMANILGVSDSAVRKARARVRQKTGNPGS